MGVNTFGVAILVNVWRLVKYADFGAIDEQAVLVQMTREKAEDIASWLSVTQPFPIKIVSGIDAAAVHRLRGTDIVANLGAA